MTRLHRLALLLAVLAWCALAMAALVMVLGSLSLPALGLSMSRASRLLVAVGILAVAAVWCRGGTLALLDDLGRSRAPHIATLLLVIVWFTALVVARGAVSVGGGDSAGYLAQAQRWSTGHLHVPLPLSIPGVADPWVQSSLGMRPDPTGSATVPTYPPGLPWVEAVALRVGGEALAIRALPLIAGLIALLALWHLAVARAGYAGAAVMVTCLASLPSFLFQALQPMSDVPALAAWLLALALASWGASRGTAGPALGAAFATLLAILIRPNLAPLAAAVAWQAALPQAGQLPRYRRGLLVGAGATVAVIAVAAVQAFLYGSPLQSGYGSAAELFAWRHVPDNLRLYGAWLSEGVAWPARLVLAVGAAWMAWDAAHRARWRPALAATLLTVALYLVYIPFDSWTYLRFVLVPLALAPAGAAGLLATLQASRHQRWVFPVTSALVLAVALPNLGLARQLSVFGVRAREYRYEAAGRFVGAQLPTTTVIVAGHHSASAPYYSGRPVVRADLLTPAGLAALEAWAVRNGRPLAFVLDEPEWGTLRRRLGHAEIATLSWPPRAEVGRPVATRIWVAADRGAYLAGDIIPTTRITQRPH